MTHRSAKDPAPVLALRDVSKSFGAVRALRDVSLDLFPGEVHALAGENGAGKSTLIKTFAGVHRPDAGQLLLDGEPATFHGPADARDAGIAVIYQEPTLFPDLSIAENIFMGRQPRRSCRRIDHRATRTATAALMHRLGVALDPDRPARGLSIADQQIVEIAKALSFDARVLIMDEPTAALTGSEVARLFGVVRALREQGAAVLFISHRLEEIFRVCERVTTLRDGALIASEPLAGMTEEDLVRRMVGRDLDELYPKQEVEAGAVALSVRRLTREGVFTDVSFDVRRGEIVGMAGLVGAGRTEVARAVFGVDRWDAGEVEVAGRALVNGAPSTAMAAGLALVPEDRRAQGLVMGMSIERNIGLTGLRATRRAGLMDRGAERSRSLDWALRLQVKYARIADAVSTLSGGNQQKVLFGRWLMTGPRILVLVEPTRGMDVGAKSDVIRLVTELAADGASILIVSSEPETILALSHRVLVARRGHIVREFAGAMISKNTLMEAVQ
ncbi:sugar ABC transporter ATP-binding protein [Streptomyces anulatus]|uniref:sugar ABC transporter ATP-binding protein n=1 Tax=Streptomyces anulatus TaxID=1892 RepID=UPI00341606D1